MPVVVTKRSQSWRKQFLFLKTEERVPCVVSVSVEVVVELTAETRPPRQAPPHFCSTDSSQPEPLFNQPRALCHATRGSVLFSPLPLTSSGTGEFQPPGVLSLPSDLFI